MCSRFSYCHGGGGYLSLYFLAERQEIKGRQSSLLDRLHSISISGRLEKTPLSHVLNEIVFICQYILSYPVNCNRKKYCALYQFKTYFLLNVLSETRLIQIVIIRNYPNHIENESRITRDTSSRKKGNKFCTLY